MREWLIGQAFQHPNLLLALVVASFAIVAITLGVGGVKVDQWWQIRTAKRLVVEEAEAVVAEAAARIARAGGL